MAGFTVVELLDLDFWPEYSECRQCLGSGIGEPNCDDEICKGQGWCSHGNGKLPCGGCLGLGCHEI